MSIKLISTDRFGIKTYRLDDEKGNFAEIISYGARIHRLCVKNRRGKLVEVLAGFDSAKEYLGDNPYFNAVIGRVANRIGGAEFSLDGQHYTLFKNDGNNHLHGGKEGFDRKMWDSEIADGALVLSRFSPHGEEGYPSDLFITVKYTFRNGELQIEYNAKADNTTLCNLTNHAYFNLSGFEKNVLEEIVFIDSTRITAIDDQLIPNGDILDISDSSYDFSKRKAIGKDIFDSGKFLDTADGYDFNYVLDGTGYRLVADAYSPCSGIKMEVFTDMPCMQFYTGNFLNGLVGRKLYTKHSAFCMETQLYPNACNIEHFPSVTLKKGEFFKSKTSYKFSVCE